MKKKSNLTVQYLLDQKPDYTGTQVRQGSIPENRVPVNIFTNCICQFESTYEGMATSIENSALDNAVFIFDTCFITEEEVPDIFWDAALKRNIVFFPTMLSELMLWLRNPKHNRYFHDKFQKAFTSKVPGIEFVEQAKFLGKPEAPYHIAAMYYHKLLSLRKTAYQDFTEAHKMYFQTDSPPAKFDIRCATLCT